MNFNAFALIIKFTKCFLHQIFRFVVITQDAVRVPTQWRVKLLEEHFICFVLSRFQAVYVYNSFQSQALIKAQRYDFSVI